MGLETIFWPSAWCSWGRNTILHARDHQSLGPPCAEMGRRQRAAFSRSGEEGVGVGGPVQREFHWGENFPTSRKGRGLAGPSRQRRGRLPLLSNTVIHRCLWIVQGALQPGSGSPPATPWLHRGSPRRDTQVPLQQPKGLEVDEWTKASPCAATPSAASTPRRVFVPPAPRVPLWFFQGTPVLEASGPRVAPALFCQRDAGTQTLTVHPGEKKQDPRRPPPRRLFCAPATGHNHGRWRERGDGGGGKEEGGGGAGARRRRRRRAPGCSLRSPRRREEDGRGRHRRRPRARPPSLGRSPAPTPGCARTRRWAALPGAEAGRARARARGEGAAGARLRPRAVQAGGRRQPPDRTRAGSRAHPCDRQSPGPPALVPAPRSAGLSESRDRFPRDWRGRAKAVPIDARARERRPLGPPAGERGPARGSAAVPGLRAAPAGGARASWRLRRAASAGRSWAENLGVPFYYPYMPPLNIGAELGVGGRRVVPRTPAAGLRGRLRASSGCTPTSKVPGMSRARLVCGALPVWRGSRGRWFDIVLGGSGGVGTGR